MSSKNELYSRNEPSLSSWERTLYDDVSKSEHWSLVEAFSNLRRLSPSDDEVRSAEYLTDRFDKYGIPYERYDPEFWLSVPEAASVRVTGSETASFSGTEEGFEDEPPAVKGLAYSNNDTVTGDAVLIDVPEAKNSDDILGKSSVDLSEYDLDGKIVLVDAMILAKGFFQEIEAAGADGLVMIHPNEVEPHISTAMPIWGAIPRLDQQDMIPDIVYAVVNSTIGTELREYAQTEGVEFEVTTEMATGWDESPFVLAKIPGEVDPDSDEFILLHGHLDSWYYGVTDNATGTAAMVECARVLNDHRDRLRRDLWIAFWPAHEGGRYGGSSWFVDEFAHELYDNCLTHVNVDSPGVADATEFDMTAWHIEGDGLCRTVIDDVTGKGSKRSRPPRAADYAFYNLGVTGLMALSSSIPADLRVERGYNAVGGSGGDATAWHLTTDTLEKSDPDVLQRDIRVYLILVARLLTKPFVPLDYRRTVTDHLETVATYDEQAGDHFDLSAVTDALETLQRDLNAFHSAIERGDLSPKDVNDARRRLSRRLVPIDFSTDGRFQQDPATHRPPYPSLRPVTDLPALTGDEYRFRKRNLDRTVNEIVHELRQARRALP